MRPRAAWQTPEGIAVKPAYDARDLASLDFLDGMPGVFLRSPYPDVCAEAVDHPAVFRLLTPSSNAFYRRNLAAGQQGVSIAFDLATHRGYDSIIRG